MWDVLIVSHVFIVHQKFIFNRVSWILSGSATPAALLVASTCCQNWRNSKISCFAKVLGDKILQAAAAVFLPLCHFWRAFSPYRKPASRGIQMRPSPRGGK